jgi:hypothetical protein
MRIFFGRSRCSPGGALFFAPFSRSGIGHLHSVTLFDAETFAKPIDRLR